MENSPRYSRDDAYSFLPSPSSRSSIPTLTRPVTSRSESTTFVHTDSSSFKQIVQMLTGSSKNPSCPKQTQQPDPRSSIHSIKGVPNKKQSSSSSSSSGFRLYERRNSKNHLKINTMHSRLPDKFSPSTIFDFPSLLLSPDTPLLSDPFYRSGFVSQSPSGSGFRRYDPRRDSGAEERGIREKGFYLHPSPSSDSEPRLLTLFPLTSPRVSDSLGAST